ncbi:MAG: hypothetical protein LBN07_02995 [Christensenellaceae bacterium]|jgi:dTMP kinase|nr:hypothetical protein [Christensenellaceae bacterium]
MFLKSKQIIVIDGSDGAGKETVSRGLEAYLNHIGISAKRFSFPMYDTPEGHEIAVLLGKTDIDAYAENKIKNAQNLNEWGQEYPRLPESFLEEYWKTAAKIYADERAANIGKILDCPAQVIICDRYTFSNMAYQSAKHYLKAQTRGTQLSTTEDLEWADDIMKKHASWIADLEYNKLSIPEPNKTIFLYRPHDDAMKRVKERGEKVDVHEANKNYQLFVERTYKILAESLGATKVDTLDEEGETRSRASIFAEVAVNVLEHLGQPIEHYSDLTETINDAHDFAKDFYAQLEQN